MPRDWGTLSDADLETLGDLGFRVPSDVRSKAHSRNLQKTQGPAGSPDVHNFPKPETEGPAGSPNSPNDRLIPLHVAESHGSCTAAVCHDLDSFKAAPAGQD